jgi:hypothetical protein
MPLSALRYGDPMQTWTRALFMILFIVPMVSLAAGRDFGPDGSTGLTADQKKALSQGEIVFATTKAAGGKELIEAAIVFDKTPKETWALLTQTEKQSRYLDECDNIKVVKRTATESKEVHTVKVAFFTIVYGVLFKFQESEMYFHWWLDPSRKNDLAGLEGFWKLYSYGEGKTLARYGSFVSIKNIPSWIESAFKERGVRKALLSVAKYVNSGGTYHK